MRQARTHAASDRARRPDTVDQAARDAARLAGLAYVSDDAPGIRREGAQPAFRYRDSKNRLIRDHETLARIRSLAIPPAWTSVWICRNPEGHIQATGRDARGRKQYRYHPRWREVRDAGKYERMIAFGKALPAIRKRVKADLRRRGLCREKVLAAVVRLLELSSIRVGNEEYAAQNRSFGLTTLQDRHARTSGPEVSFNFPGKSGRRHAIRVRHPVIATVVRECRKLPGRDLFEYIDAEGQSRDITAADVNAYLREITGQDFTAKDFRTWTGTVLAAMALREFEPIATQTAARRNIVRAIEQVAARLGNTPSVCRKCYVHPVVLNSYLEGTLARALQQDAEREMASLNTLPPEEAAVLALLQQRLKNGPRPKRQRPERSLSDALAASLQRKRP